ncbi:Sodium/hydrogen exchanger [Armillaria novae-zelandiae]|uniref:Sodium/hydrogen exchanger n=1 Tax=Armillaria novae-zelandiae TaxID=153914 RepID=A0AA39UG01_9AGAR|nr:Sodium/hydrogen exchanger [Armillaria novae-zelandiae]
MSISLISYGSHLPLTKISPDFGTKSRIHSIGRLCRSFFVNEVVLGTAFDVSAGPYACGIFNPHSWGSSTQTVTLEVMRIVLAIGLFIIGVELPGPYMARHVKGLLVMVVPTHDGILRALFPGLNFVPCLAVAACLTPTDPIICAAIVVYPFLSISIYLTVESSKRVAFEKWLIIECLHQVIMGVVIGAVLGLAFFWLMKRSLRRGFVDREFYVAQYLASDYRDCDALSWDEHINSQTEDELFATVIDRVLNCASFVYIGAWLRFDIFNDPLLGINPRPTLFFIVILVLRRVPSMLLLYKWIPEISSWSEALFCSHFGPQELLATMLQPTVSFIVLGSIIIRANFFVMITR